MPVSMPPKKKDLPDRLQLLISSETGTIDGWKLQKTSENHIRTLQHQKSQLETVSFYEDFNWLYYIHSNAIFPNSKANTRIAKDAFLCCRIQVMNSITVITSHHFYNLQTTFP